MAAGMESHTAMAQGLAYILGELAQVQPLFGYDDLVEDVEEYIELDGSEVPIMDHPFGFVAVQEDSVCYIDIPVQGQTVRVSCQML